MLPETLYSGEFLRAVGWNLASARRVIVTFDYYRATRSGFPAVRRSSRFTSKGLGQVSISTAANDWFLNPDLKPLRAALRLASEPWPEVIGLGLSMGGYGALMLSRALKMSKVLLISPQLSILPRLAPFEARWRAEAARLDPRLDRPDLSIREGLRGVTLFDPAMRRDRDHAWAIAALAPGIRPMALRFSGHPAIQHIVNADCYADLQQIVMGGRIAPSRIRSLHRAAREASPLWQAQLGEWADSQPDALAHKPARHARGAARRGRLGPTPED